MSKVESRRTKLRAPFRLLQRDRDSGRRERRIRKLKLSRPRGWLRVMICPFFGAVEKLTGDVSVRKACQSGGSAEPGLGSRLQSLDWEFVHGQKRSEMLRRKIEVA